MESRYPYQPNDLWCDEDKNEERGKRKEERGKRKRRYIVLCFEFGAQPDKWWDYAR